jgi:hypothetical protein
MNKTQYRAALKKLDLSIVGAAPILGISRRQSQRIAAGDSPVPEPLEKLLHFMIESSIALRSRVEAAVQKEGKTK